MKLALGIDAGGTYTDAVLFDSVSGQIRVTAKAATTPHNLAIGVGQAIGHLADEDCRQVRLVSISTTLATNSIVEGRGGQVGLILIGYDEEHLRRSGLAERLPVEDIRFVAGGHNVKGDEAAPLDEEAVRQAVLALRDRVDAFAVSGYFGVMNPDHELRVRKIIAELSPVPVVCGHELTSKLNALKRVSTAVLNARLLPVIQELLDSVNQVLAGRGIAAPLLVVKGDGSLISEEIARQRPVETILSGPAASAIGGQFLAGQESAIVVDMGGTTTDIAVLRDGQPWTNPAGATVGGWQTSVLAADLRTIGMGGDSYVRVERGETLRVGPRRAIPLCRLGAEWPEIVRELEAGVYAGAGELSIQPTDFLTTARSSGGVALTDTEQGILRALERGPLSIAGLCRALRRHNVGSERLEALGILRRAGLTPTDLLLLHPQFDGLSGWLDDAALRPCRPAALAGARIIARQLGLSVDELIGRVLEIVVDSVAREILDKLVADETGEGLSLGARGWAFLLERALECDGQAAAKPVRVLRCCVELAQPIVAIGAPVKGFMPRVAEKLHTRCIIPAAAEVGNAVGTVVASISQTVEVLVQPHVPGAGTVTYLIHTPWGREATLSWEGALARAEEVAVEQAREAVRQSGAEAISVKVDRREVVLGKLSEMTIRARATGRPRLG